MTDRTLKVRASQPGGPEGPADMRCDSCSKRLHSWYRPRMKRNFNEYVCKTQFGGANHRGTDFCAHVVRLHKQMCTKRRLSSSQLFIDAVSAFDSIIREFVFVTWMDEIYLARLFHKFGYDSQDYHAFMQQLTAGTVLSESGVSPHAEALVTQTPCCSWFPVQGSKSSVCTSRGTKAGETIADMVFNFLVAKTLKDIEQSAVKAGLTSTIPCCHASDDAARCIAGDKHEHNLLE